MKLPKQEWIALKKRKKEIKNLIRRKEIWLDIKDMLTSLKYHLPAKKIPIRKLKDYKLQIENFHAWITIFDDLTESEKELMGRQDNPRYSSLTYPEIP